MADVKTKRKAPSDDPVVAAERMRRYRQTERGKLETAATNYARVELVKRHRSEFEFLRAEYKAKNGGADEGAA